MIAFLKDLMALISVTAFSGAALVWMDALARLA